MAIEWMILKSGTNGTSITWLRNRNGDPNGRATHAIMPLTDYDELVEKLKKLEKFYNDHRNYQTETKEIIKNKEQELDLQNQEIKKFRKEVEDAEAKVEYQKNLNKALLRINKEYANVDRNLRPKKQHVGYVVLSSTEKTYSYKEGSFLKSLEVWETTLQTPFSVDFTAEQVQEETLKLFLPDETGRWPIRKIGIKGYNTDPLKDTMSSNEKDKFVASNSVFISHLQANYKVGYWEMLLVHTKPLIPVPKEMKPTWCRNSTVVTPRHQE